MEKLKEDSKNIGCVGRTGMEGVQGFTGPSHPSGKEGIVGYDGNVGLRGTMGYIGDSPKILMELTDYLNKLHDEYSNKHGRAGNLPEYLIRLANIISEINKINKEHNESI